MAAQGTSQFHSREGLTYELMDPVSQCLVSYMIFQTMLWLSDSVSEELGLGGRDRIHLMGGEILQLLTGFLTC